MLKTSISGTFLMLNEPDNASFHFSDLDITLKKRKFVAIPAYMQMKKRISKLIFSSLHTLYDSTETQLF